MAAIPNRYTGETVRRAFQDNLKENVKFNDNQVTLYWKNNQEKPLKKWVRNRVVEINRLTKLKDRMFLRSEDMIPNIDTIHVSDLDIVGKDSV